MRFTASLVINLLIMLSALTSYNSAFLFANVKPNRSSDVFGLRAIETQFSTPKGRELITNYDVLRAPLRFLREQLFAQFNAERSFRHNVRLGKIQREIPADTPFPCDLRLSRSLTTPTTVHKLRPGDIDIIAAMGDSMTAGTCLMAENFLQLWHESRGIAFSGGGFGNWRKFLTLPNILKVFNPNLYGYAIADGFSFDSTTRFNVAEPTAMSRDLVYQAKLLIRRLRQDSNVDLKRHWKLLTIFIGNVDFCGDFCTYDDVLIPLRNHERDLRESLTLLRENVPHLFVNLLATPNSIGTLKSMKLSPHCYVIQRAFCFCVSNSSQTEAESRSYEARIRLWQDLDAHIASLDEFNTDDFTVVYHPFLNDPRIPTLPNGDVDQRYFAADCFHFSQLGHASLANSLWNSMMQPVGYKQKNYNDLFERFECPSLERPYLPTIRNSLNFEL